jgi:PadR family transcriptional regulator PadR
MCHKDDAMPTIRPTTKPATPTKVETELLRGAGPLAVLTLLRQRQMYGYELVEAVSQRTQGVLAMGQSTLYPLLYNLEAKGLIEAAWETSDSGRDRKYYRLTAKGRKRLAEDEKQWSALVGAMKELGVGGVGGLSFAEGRPA